MGRVLLLTFSKALGPMERVGLWVEDFFVVCDCDDGGADDDEGRDIEPVVEAEGEGDGTGVGVAVLLWMTSWMG